MLTNKTDFIAYYKYYESFMTATTSKHVGAAEIAQ